MNTTQLPAPRPRALLLRALLMVGLPAALTTALLLLPWPALDAARDERPGARITDRTGVLLAVMPGRDGAFQLREGPVGSQGGIPAACAELFIQLEDKRFRQHPGIDPLAFARALGQRVLGQATQSGASTITMQLARIVAPHPRSVPGKAREALEAVRLEARLTKDEILDLYLNEVPFGRNARGVGAAAWTYFGADLETLDAAQFLVLAIIPRNPTVYDPFLHPAALEEAAIQIDDRLGLGIPAAEIRAAVKGARTDRPQGAAPHFARYVAGLVADGGMSPSRGVVRTTLDAALNAGIEARVQFVLERYARARVTNAAVVVLDNTTGAVVGWVGSRDFNDTATSGQIDGVLIRRQSASTLKPFLYADALQAGWTAATLLPDVPMVFGSADEEAYRPQNFDNRSHGVVRVRTALASSLNVPAVYTLSHVGVDTFFGTLGALGFHLPTDAAGRWGLGAAVGNVEVTLLDLAHGFTVFPRGGTVIPVSVTAAPAPTPRRVFDTFTAWLITDILSDPSARATGFGIHTFFRTDFPALFKSGTSSEFTNLWCVGATPRFTVAAWAGNFDGRAVINKTGSIVPAQIVTDVLTAVTATVPGAARLDFVRPASAVAAVICTSTGAAAGAGCGPTRTEYFRNTREVPRAGAGGGSVARTGGDALLQDQFLDGTHPVRILFPVSGQVFYRDTTVRAVGQGLPVLIAARQGTRPTVTYDGRVIPAGSNPSEIILPLTRGMHTITVSSPEGSDRSRFEVR